MDNKRMTKTYEPKIIKLMEGDIKKYHKVLLEYGGFDNIRDAKQQTGNNAKQIYSHRFDELQTFIYESNKQEYKKKFQSIAVYNKEKNQKTKLEKEVLKQQKQIAELKQKIQKLFNHLNTLAKSYKLNPETKISKAQRKKRYEQEQKFVKQAKDKLKNVLKSNQKVVGVWINILKLKGMNYYLKVVNDMVI